MRKSALLYDMDVIGKKFSARTIISDLTNYIVSNELRPGTLLQPPGKLAERYMVSTQTVNRALDQMTKRGLVYRERGRGTFVAKRPDTAGLRVSLYLWAASPQFGLNSFTETLMNELNSYGFQINLKMQSSDVGYFKNEHPQASDALIIPAGMCTPKTIPFLRELEIPVIMIFGEKVYELPFHQVSFDYRPGFRKALEYLRKKNHRKLLIASWSGNTTIDIRVEALVECADDMDFEHEFLPELIPSSLPYINTQWRLSYGREIAKYYHQNKLQDVIFSPCGFLTLGIIDYMAEHKLKPGVDYKLISYDNVEKRGITPFGDPIITAISYPQEEMAIETVKLLVNILKHPSSQSYAYNIVRVTPHELVIRKTV